MEPQIQYARTSDGVSIAYYAIGSGPPLVSAQLPFSHLQLEWHNPTTRRLYESAARVGTWIRYDHRGFGLSDRAVNDFTLDCLAADLEAVTDQLHLDRFALISIGSTSPMAIQYAAEHPRRVLAPGFTRGDGVAWDQWTALASTAIDDWDFVSEAMLRASFGWEDEESSRRYAELLRNTITPQTMHKFLQDARQWDASESVPRVTMPTLLLHTPSDRNATMENTRRLAAALPDGRLVMIDGVTSSERSAQVYAAIARFLGGDPAAAVLPSTEPDHAGTAIILFTDIVDSTALTERMGDAPFRTASRALDAAIRGAMRAAGGTPVEGKVLGDGVMGVFTSATQAIDAARRCVSASADSELRLHVGLHAGDVIREEDNVYRGAVNIASRICGLCESGEILVSQTIRDLARTSAGVTFEDRGERAPKGIDDPVRVFSVRPESG